MTTIPEAISNLSDQEYFGSPEISNSDLSDLKMRTSTQEEIREYREAMRFGRAFDYILTTPEKVDFLNKRLPDGTQFSDEDYFTINKMVQSVKKSQYWDLLKQCSMQQVFKNTLKINVGAMDFEITCKVKYDFFHWGAYFGGDYKSTIATSQKQFEAQIHFNDIDRQRAFYLDVSQSDKDLIIGISKKNFQIFPVRIKRGDAIYNIGKTKYSELAFRWWSLFSEVPEYKTI